MKKLLLYAASAMMLCCACSSENKNTDSADSAAAQAAQMQELESQRTQDLENFKAKTIDAMVATTLAVEADPGKAQSLYDDFTAKMEELQLSNSEFMQELLEDSTYQAEGRKFQAAMEAAGVHTNHSGDTSQQNGNSSEGKAQKS